MSIKYSIIPIMLISLVGCIHKAPASHSVSSNPSAYMSCTEKEAYEAGKSGYIYELYKCPEDKQYSLKLSYRLGGFDARRVAR